MKKLLLYLFLGIACFHLAGGFACAASAVKKLTQQADKGKPEDVGELVVKKTAAPELQLLQISKQESEEDDSFLTLQLFPFQNQFTPDFRLFNKHFLIYYSQAIKSHLPALFLLHSVFRL